jgi:hypothetical protein
MAQREDFVTGTGTGSDLGSDLGAGHGRSSDAIRSEIDRTRSNMDETFAALDSKLTPSQIGLEVWNLFKGGSTAGAGKLWRVAREHPMPAAVIGLGLGWLLVESSRKEEEGYDGRYRGGRSDLYGGYGYGRGSYGGDVYGEGYEAGSYGFETGEDQSSGRLSELKDGVKDKVHDLTGSAREAVSGAKHKVGDATEWTKEHASDLSHRAKDRAVSLKGQARTQVRRAKTGFWQTMEANPLLVGAATLALGVIAGLAIPETEKENELMGETRDRLFEEVKEAGQQTLEKGQHVAEAVADKVKEEVRNAGLTPEGVADKVKQVAQEATNTAKEEAKRQNLMPAGQQNQTANAEVHEHEPELVKR